MATFGPIWVGLDDCLRVHRHTDQVHLFHSFFIENGLNILFLQDNNLGGFIWISIPTIFAGSPRSVTSHSPHIIPFISDISLTNVVNSNRSSTHTVMISKSPLRCLHTYTHGSERNRRKLCFLTQMSNCIFHSHPDCFSPYRVFTNVQMRGRAASSAAAVCGASGKMASVGGSNGFAGHTRGGSECRQLVIDVHIARFVLATQYNVWSNAT